MPEAKDTLWSALLAAQREMPAVEKDSTAKVQGKSKAGRDYEYSYQYVSFDQLLSKALPVLHKHGIVLLQMPSALPDGSPSLTTALIHGPSGERIEREMPLLLAANDPQGLGSAITYARRYAVTAFLGISGQKDDDAQAAMPREEPRSSDSPMSLAAAIDRLDMYVEDSKPWIRRYAENTYSELEGSFPENAKDLPTKVRLDLLSRLINVVAALPEPDERLEYETEFRNAFAQAFDGLIVDVEYRPSIPF